MEIWKSIESLNGLYQASNSGQIKRLERVDNNGHRWGELILKQCVNKNGYCRVHVSLDGKTASIFVHRLVAECFCERPDGCDIVNHIDNNPRNNSAENLEWTTYKGNMQHASRQGRMKGHLYIRKASEKSNKLRKKPVIVTDKNGKSMHFESQAEAARTLGVGASHIAAACRKEYGYKTIGGYSFKYADPKLQGIKPKRVGKSKEECIELTRKRMLGNQYGKGIRCSESAKIASKKRRGKPVCQYDVNGNFIREFMSVREIRTLLGYSVEYALDKKRDRMCHGYVWRYKNE